MISISTLVLLSGCSNNMPAPQPDNGALELGWDDRLAHSFKDYPEFAGYYLDDDGKIVIRIKDYGKNTTSNQNYNDRLESIKSKVLENFITFHGYQDISKTEVKFLPSEYSFEQIHEWRKSLRPLLGAPVSSLSLNYFDTTVNVGFDSNQITLSSIDAQAFISAKIEELGIPSDAINFEAGSIEYTTGSLWTDAYYPPVGGMGWNYYKNGETFICSVGVPVTYNSTRGFLTAAHCTVELGSDPIKREAFDLKGNRLATEGFDQEGTLCSIAALNQSGYNPLIHADKLCRYTDVAFMALTNSYGPTYDTGKIIRTTEAARSTITTRPVEEAYNVVGGVRMPAAGQVLENVGASSGWKQAKVIELDKDFISIESGSGKTIYTLNQVGVQSTISGKQATCGGDSGGPWYFKNPDGSVQFVGIQSAGRNDTIVPNPRKDLAPYGKALCYGVAYLTPLDGILRTMNTSLKYTR